MPGGLSGQYTAVHPFGLSMPPPPPTFGGPPPPPTPQPEHTTTHHNSSARAAQQPTQLDKLEHVHPVLRGHLAEYHRVFRGSMMFGRVLKAANLNWEDLPNLPGYVDERGKNLICFNHVCGRCTFRPCRLRKGHVPKEKIPAEWANGLWRQIAPGIRYNLQATAPASDSESPQKKQKM